MSKKGTEFTYEYESSEHLISHSSLEIISTLFQEAQSKKRISEKSVQIPTFIFRKGLSPLSAITKYLHENLGLKFSQIALILGRDQRTVWTEYNYVKKQPRFSSELIWAENNFVSTEIFLSRQYSVLESIVFYFIKSGFSVHEISEMLGKNPSTIRTAQRRAKIKSKGGSKK